MKKLVLLIVALLLVSIVVVHAEGIDLSEMTTEELIELDLAITEELRGRDTIVENYLYQGKYVVGEDFEEGRYLLKCSKVLNDRDGYGSISVYTDGRGNDHANLMLNHEWSVDLRNSDILKLMFIECSIVKIK
jgi:hypothetical protein